MATTEKPYSPEEAKKALDGKLFADQTPLEQLKALQSLPKDQLRQVILGMLRGDV